MNEALDWMFEELWNTPKDKFEWNAILKKAKDVAKVYDTCDKNNNKINNERKQIKLSQITNICLQSNVDERAG